MIFFAPHFHILKFDSRFVCQLSNERLRGVELDSQRVFGAIERLCRDDGRLEGRGRRVDVDGVGEGLGLEAQRIFERDEDRPRPVWDALRGGREALVEVPDPRVAVEHAVVRLELTEGDLVIAEAEGGVVGQDGELAIGGLEVERHLGVLNRQVITGLRPWGLSPFRHLTDPDEAEVAGGRAVRARIAPGLSGGIDGRGAGGGLDGQGDGDDLVLSGGEAKDLGAPEVKQFSRGLGLLCVVRFDAIDRLGAIGFVDLDDDAELNVIAQPIEGERVSASELDPLLGRDAPSVTGEDLRDCVGVVVFVDTLRPHLELTSEVEVFLVKVGRAIWPGEDELHAAGLLGFTAKREPRHCTRRQDGPNASHRSLTPLNDWSEDIRRDTPRAGRSRAPTRVS